MVQLIRILVLLFVFGGSTASLAGGLLIRDVNIIDGLGHQVHPMRDVLIIGEHIAQIGVSGALKDIPPGTTVIDGVGMTLLPGLLDLHVHLEGEEGDIATGLRALLYAGVTSVLDLGSPPDSTSAFQKKVRERQLPGPTIHTTGATIQRLRSIESVMDLTAAGAEEIRAMLDERQAQGAENIKLYAGLSPWSARHISEAAHRRGLQVIADFWCFNLSRDMYEVSGVDGFAHGACAVIPETTADYMLKNHKFVLMTLSVFDTMGGHRAYADYPIRGYLENPLIVDVLGQEKVNQYYDSFAQMREAYEDGEQSLYNAQLFGDLKHLLSSNQENARMLVEQGVLVGMGTDAAFPPGTWFGESMHHELELHVQAGIEPIKAIQLATYNNARILRREQELGSIEAGKVADILIVRGNPAEDIRATRNIAYVIQSGEIVDREALIQH